jgi:uncharacterized protein (DUF2141 family)
MRKKKESSFSEEKEAKRLLFLALLLGFAPAKANTVTVDVTGVLNARGHIRVALCTKADFLQPHCRWKGKSPSLPGTVAVKIEDVPPGTYAAEAFHDENDNERLDRTFLGMPKEALGFSNNAPMHFGPPKFDAASFRVGKTDVRITFSLKYY